MEESLIIHVNQSTLDKTGAGVAKTGAGVGVAKTGAGVGVAKTGPGVAKTGAKDQNIHTKAKSTLTQPPPPSAAKKHFKAVVRQAINLSKISPKDKELLKRHKLEARVLSDHCWMEYESPVHRYHAGQGYEDLIQDWRVYHKDKMSFEEYYSQQIKAQKITSDETQHVEYVTKSKRRKEVEVTFKIGDDGNPTIVDHEGQPLRDGEYITVLGTDLKFYAKEKVRGRFQHSSFFAGQPVVSAGMFFIKNGKIEKFASRSGHYRPRKKEIFQALLWLEEQGIDISKIPVEYDKKNKGMVNNPKEWREYTEYVRTGLVQEPQPVKPDPQILAHMRAHAKEKIPELDVNAAKLLTTLGGGIFDPSAQVIVPSNPTLVADEWERTKNRFARVVGKIEGSVTKNNKAWKKMNSTSEVAKELTADKAAVLPQMNKIYKQVNKHSGCEVISEPGNNLEKTLIAKNAAQTRAIVNALQEAVQTEGGEILFVNFWEADRDNGYVGIHAKIKLPVPQEEGSPPKFVVTEVQIHLPGIQDNTPSCVANRDKEIHKNANVAKLEVFQADAASQLLYTAAIQQALT